MKVIKRDGTTVEFDRNKIKRAIRKANEAVDPDFRVTEEQVEQIVHNIESKKRNRYLVEDIQDMVEHDLMLMGKYTGAGPPRQHHRRFNSVADQERQQGRDGGKLQQKRRDGVHPA